MKKFTVIFFLFLSVKVAAQIPTNGLVAYYPFNGDATDQSGNGLDPTTNTAILTSDRNSESDKAYYFDGSTSYMTVPHNTLLDLKDSLTISMWINIDLTKPAGTGHHLIVKGSNSTNEYSIVLDQNSKKIGFNKQGIQAIALSNTILTTNTWYHIVVSYKYPDAKLYINGVLDVEGTISSPFTSSNSSLSIGTINSLAGNDVTKGKIDDIAIYNRELSQSEINSIYTTVTAIGPSPNNKNLINVYPNPTNTIINIDNGNYSMMNNCQVKIYNSLGTEVYNSFINQQLFTIDINTLGGTGTYFLKISDPSNTIVENKTILIQ